MHVGNGGHPMPPPLPLHGGGRAGQQHHRSGGCGSSGSTTTATTASPPRTFSPTPTPRCTTRSTARSTPSTCCASSRACRCTATSPTGSRMGRELLDLHIGFESPNPTASGASRSGTVQAGKATSCGPTRKARHHHPGWPDHADRRARRGVALTGSAAAPPWSGCWTSTRSARLPGTPPSRKSFNTYRFADHKERVVDLLQRVCAVSVGTMEIIDQMADLQVSQRAAP